MYKLHCQYYETLLLVGRHVQGCTPTCQQLQAMYSISSQQDVYSTHAFGNPSSTIHWVSHGAATSKDNRHALIFICLLTSYLITVPLKSRRAGELSMAYIKEILAKTSCPRFILQDNGTKFKNEQLMSVFDSLSIKCIYSNLYYPKGKSKIENVHSLLKCTIVKFLYDSQLEWDYALPLATYCYNIAPSMDDLESLFYLVHCRDPIEGRLSNLQNYCRYMGDQPG